MLGCTYRKGAQSKGSTQEQFTGLWKPLTPLHLGLGGSLQPSPAQILAPTAEKGCWAQLGRCDSTGYQKATRRQACGRRVSETAQGAEGGG